ncbi:hypothetical protein ACWCSH_45150, partial [Streptosporangium sp. NPDC001682]
MDAISTVPAPINEPVLGYAPGSAERTALENRVKELAGAQLDLTMTIGGEQRMGGGAPIDVVQLVDVAPGSGHRVSGDHSQLDEVADRARDG